jgi:Gly-Xaa carboxypeptidase
VRTETCLSSAIELLLESGKFTPTRTVILALGIDEETGGKVVRLFFPALLEDVLSR